MLIIEIMTISLQFRAAIGVDNIDYWSIIDLLTQIVNKFPNSANTTTILTVTTTILTVFASTFLVIICHPPGGAGKGGWGKLGDEIELPWVRMSNHFK